MDEKSTHGCHACRLSSSSSEGEVEVDEKSTHGCHACRFRCEATEDQAKALRDDCLGKTGFPCVFGKRGGPFYGKLLTFEQAIGLETAPKEDG